MKKLFTLLSASLLSIAAFAQSPSLSTLTASQKLNGFTAKAVYLNDAKQSMGARFIHDRTGFTFDLLQIETVPQTFIWVNTPPVSDKGEPHTQEHLLITKGNKGRNLNTRESMSITESNAFTSQIFTAYNFSTGAGTDVFYQNFEQYMDALLHPDYSAEEVSREVRNWGVTGDAGKMKLEEKGSVYNEMKSTSNSMSYVAFREMKQMVYGESHPISYEAGGTPAGIRILNADDIRAFHDNNYHLYNMGAITALPKTMSLTSVLASMNAILNRLQPGPALRQVTQSAPPVMKPAAAGTVKTVLYPSMNEYEPGLMAFILPAGRDMSITDDVMISSFFSSFAGDASTNLYKKFVDSKTREISFDAQATFASMDNHEGNPVYFGLFGVPPSNLTEEKADLVWKKIQDELAAIAAYKDGSKELQEFNDRFKNELIDYRRTLSKFTNTPPLFGGRNTGDNWYQQLLELNSKTNEFKKSVTLAPQLAEIDALLASGKNFWGTYFAKWKLMNPSPYTIMAKANKALFREQDSATKARTADELASLKLKYNLTDDQEAIKKYKEEYDANTVALEKSEQSEMSKFIDNPPLTFDDMLDYKTTVLPGNVSMTASTFNNMTGATTGLALKLNKLPQDKLVYLAMFPDLLTRSGLYKNGKAISYEDMSQQQRKEILSLNAYYSNSPVSGRSELMIKGSGNNKDESVRSVQWMNDILQSPYWKTENLSRIRDLVNQSLNGIRRTMQGREESWVQDPGTAYRAQDNMLLLSTSSFLTRTHNIQRLRWMLMDGGNASERTAASAYLQQLSSAKGTRDDLKKLLSLLRTGDDTTAAPAAFADLVTGFRSLKGNALKTIQEAGKDLLQTLNDVPDESLQSDWQYLCLEMKKDFEQGPEKTLADLEFVRKNILHADNARMFMIGSAAMQTLLSNNVNTLIGNLSNEKQQTVKYSTAKHIEERYQQRTGTKDRIVFAGLMNPNASGGVFMNRASMVSYKDTSREKLLQFLAGSLFAGSGKQSVYTKSIGAGLSYSTGVRVSPGSGVFGYYAERTPLLPQTLQYVIEEIKKTPNDPAMKEYIIAITLTGSRSAADYESRGEEMSNDLADGLTPALISTFRKAIMKMRNDPSLMTEVYKRKDAVHEKIFPGYGAKMSTIPGGTYFVIGPEKQMAAYETYLQEKDDKGSKVARLYPRDFWME